MMEEDDVMEPLFNVEANFEANVELPDFIPSQSLEEDASRRYSSKVIGFLTCFSVIAVIWNVLLYTVITYF